MGMSFSTAEEKSRSAGSSCAPTRMRNGGGQAEGQGIRSGIFHSETLRRKDLPRGEVDKVGAGHTESGFRPRQPLADHRIQETVQLPAIRHVEKSMGMEYITVPDDQMDSFIQIASLHEKDTVYYKPDEIDIRKGTRVCIHGGKLDGVKGVFMRVKGKRNRRVVVMLEGIMGISAEVHPDLIEVIS